MAASFYNKLQLVVHINLQFKKYLIITSIPKLSYSNKRFNTT